ncbi:LPS O-antigen chain length determinant protein WzzB [Kosakonia cowanii]|jgi:chain length determinant protein (polysaccharide antigen chain regulator)|uniref:LPS O-antigen chain length determinant protein WzzB n=1 Tax=Kosakonia cowanii TaxID=208223 RepID=UPI000FEC9E01|nr:LPS O-antigen chain length determinant protein WzzB [Kosakonia cowanii]QAR45760.1 LPS O-antigen chain length determinant protein WzzB [Kosakonia cowanii]WKW44068.1 LPS O-antigen chain length determinant protein WzzB [Kosakonia cowanii]
MTDEKNKLPYRQAYEAEQIDLINVFMQIWRGKVIVALFVVLCLVIAGIYLAFAKEKWTSVAVISAPDAGQIVNYTSAMSIVSNDNRFDITGIQERVIGRFNSAFSALSETLDNQDVPEKLTIDTAVQGQSLPLKVTYQGASAKYAQQKLAEYIEQIDQLIAKELVSDLDINIKARADNLLESLTTQERVAQEQKDLRIKQIMQALTVAKESKVEAPQIQQTENVSQDTMFLLGSAALDSMIKNESSRPLIFTDDYYKTRKNLLDLQTIEVKPDTIHSYRYVMKPSLPVHRDSPRMALVMILALLLGTMIGSGVVLMRNAVRSYQPKA